MEALHVAVRAALQGEKKGGSDAAAAVPAAGAVRGPNDTISIPERSPQQQQQQQQEEHPVGDGTFDVLVLGSGVSIGIPNMGHILAGKEGGEPCEVCIRAHEDPESRERRNNVSIAILVNGTGHGDKDKDRRCILVDAGKTMRDAILRRFPKEGISGVHSLLLTHDHADATFGMDDLRDLQRKEVLSPKGIRLLDGPIAVYSQEETMARIKQQFPYMTGEIPYLDEANRVLLRNVPVLDWRVIAPDATFRTSGVPVRALPVYHGGAYISLGFEIGRPGQFIYISDCSAIPPATMAYLQSLPAPGINILVIDCLALTGTHYSHMVLPQTLAVVDALKPRKCYLTGMCCEVGMHDDMNARLREMGYPHVELAWDGMALRRLPLV